MGAADDFASIALLLMQIAQAAMSTAVVYAFTRWLRWEMGAGVLAKADGPLRSLVAGLVLFQVATLLQSSFYTANSVLEWETPFPWRMSVVVPLKALMIVASYMQVRSFIVLRRGYPCSVRPWVLGGLAIAIALLAAFFILQWQ